jgi:thiol-disulfide isomerase/thioredoxin
MIRYFGSILAGIVMLFAIQGFAQDKYDVLKDKKNKAVVIKGECTFDDLLRQPTFGWLPSGSNSYRPDTAKLSYLKKYLKDYELVVFIGTWCDDTYTMLPKLYKVLKLTGYPMSKYLMYGVDREKTSKYVEHKLYKIQDVPTVILIQNNREIGRIVETVKTSIEADLARMIDNDRTAKEREQIH